MPGSPPRARTHRPESSAITGLRRAWKSAIGLAERVGQEGLPVLLEVELARRCRRGMTMRTPGKRRTNSCLLVLVVRCQEKLVFHHADLRLSGSYTEASFLFNQ